MNFLGHQQSLFHSMEDLNTMTTIILWVERAKTTLHPYLLTATTFMEQTRLVFCNSNRIAICTIIIWHFVYVYKSCGLLFVIDWKFHEWDLSSQLYLLVCMKFIAFVYSLSFPWPNVDLEIILKLEIVSVPFYLFLFVSLQKMPSTVGSSIWTHSLLVTLLYLAIL